MKQIHKIASKMVICGWTNAYLWLDKCVSEHAEEGWKSGQYFLNCGQANMPDPCEVFCPKEKTHYIYFIVLEQENKSYLKWFPLGIWNIWVVQKIPNLSNYFV